MFLNMLSICNLPNLKKVGKVVHISCFFIRNVSFFKVKSLSLVDSDDFFMSELKYKNGKYPLRSCSGAPVCN